MKLNKILATERAVKARSYSDLTTLHKSAQKEDLYNGHAKTFRPKDVDGETFPPDSKRVQLRAEDVLQTTREIQTEFFDISLAKEVGNQSANADIQVGTEILASEVPATMLLLLEKSLIDLRTLVVAMPTLSEDEAWVRDLNSGMYRTAPVATNRQKKVQRPIVLYPATPEHPAQTQLITEDESIGYWDTTKISGALPKPRKERILARLDALLIAVKTARQEANDVEIPEPNHIGNRIFDYLFTDR